MLEKLRAFNPDRTDVDELVELVVSGKALATAYREYLLPTPEWLGETILSVEKEIKDRRKDSLAKALKSAESRLETLKSAEEKRGDIKVEIERLRAALGA